MRRLTFYLILVLGCVIGVKGRALGADSFAGLKQFGDFPKIDVHRLLEGEILSQRGPLMKFPNGISSQLVFAVPTSPVETVNRLQTWDSKRCPSLKVYASQELANPCELNEFNSLKVYLDSSLRPIKWFLDQTMSTTAYKSELNLTQIEGAELARCVNSGPSARTVASCWSHLLFSRASAFQAKGFAGSLPFELGTQSVDPVVHLRSMLSEQPQISQEFAPLLQGSGLSAAGAVSSSIKPSYYWRLFQADHHATLSLGAVYNFQVGDHYQRLELEYYVSGTYYTSATLYEIWPIHEGGKTGSLIWCDVLCSAPTLKFATGMERLASGVIMILEFKKMVQCFQDSIKGH